MSARRVLLSAAVMILIYLLFLTPVLVLAGYALSGRWSFPDLIPALFSNRALTFLFENRGRIIPALGSSLLFSLATVLFTFLISVSPARVLARYEFRARAVVEAFLLAPVLVPSIAFAMGVHYIFIRAGLIDSFPGVVLVLGMFSYPYMLRSLTAGFGVLPKELWICASNLGAGPLRIVLLVYLPLLVPAAVAGGTVVFLAAFSEYFLVFLIGGGAVDSFTGYLYPFITSSDRSIGAVLSLVFLILSILLFTLVELTVNRIYRRRKIFS
jgi:putative spermidine/putrescine transport system permease protein